LLRPDRVGRNGEEVSAIAGGTMKRGGLIILVTGGTGRQGGAAARHLLADGWKVRALVRDPSKPASQALEAAGAELFVGDLLDRASLDTACDGAHGVYSVETPREVGMDGEVREGFNVADAAYDAGVAQFVYSSVIGADREGGPGFVRAKHRIEHHIGDLGMPATIWRPTTFMENWTGHRDDILAGKLSSFAAPDEVHQFIALDDIGKFVALAFAEHDRFVGVTREIAGDEMSWAAIAELFALVLDRPVAYEQRAAPPSDATQPRPSEDAGPPLRADLESLRELIPDLITIEQWIRAQNWT
jgi:uncharacterized protein YbjT (DUF2867 family)